jgi:hypothetical protein
MAWVLAVVVLVLAAFFGVLLGSLLRRRRVKGRTTVRQSGALPRVPLRSQVIVLGPSSLKRVAREDEEPQPEQAAPALSEHEQPFVVDRPSEREAPFLNHSLSEHEKPTREFAAHVEALAALSRPSTPTREFSVHDARTREFAAYSEALFAPQEEELSRPSRAANDSARVPSGLPSRTGAGNSRRDEHETLKVGSARAQERREPTATELRQMLGASPTPDLGNIEIYYRLGLALLADGNEVEARRCFLNVEGVSPGYRDTAEQLTRLPIHAPTSSGPTPVYHVVTNSGIVPARRQGAVNDSEPARGWRTSRKS